MAAFVDRVVNRRKDGSEFLAWESVSPVKVCGDTHSVGVAPSSAHWNVAPGSFDVNVKVADVLATLPARQRAAVVLRYWSQHSVTETAAILRCSEGTVKSQSARGLAALRQALADAERSGTSGGLRGMRDRAELFGGRVELKAAAGRGTVVQMTLALDTTDTGTPTDR